MLFLTFCELTDACNSPSDRPHHATHRPITVNTCTLCWCEAFVTELLRGQEIFTIQRQWQLIDNHGLLVVNSIIMEMRKYKDGFQIKQNNHLGPQQ